MLALLHLNTFQMLAINKPSCRTESLSVPLKQFLTPQKRKSTILQLHDDPIQHGQHGSDIQKHQDDWLTEEDNMHVTQHQPQTENMFGNRICAALDSGHIIILHFVHVFFESQV